MKVALWIGAGLLILLTCVAGAGAAPPPPAQVAPAQIVPAPPADHNSPPPPLTTAPALPAAGGPVHFQADFSNPDLSAWTARPWMPGDLPAQWHVRDGRLQQAGNHFNAPSDEPAVLVGPQAGGDFQLDAALLPAGGEPVGLVWQATDGGYNRVLFQSAVVAGSGVTVQIERITGWQPTVVARQTAPVWPGWTSRLWFLASVRVAGSTVTILVNGQPVLTTPMAAGTGRVGVYATALGYSGFDNVRVQQPTTAMPTGPAGSAPPSVPVRVPDGVTPNYDDWRAPQNLSNTPGGSAGSGARRGWPTGPSSPAGPSLLIAGSRSR